jgi:hypothetical protein
MKDINLLKALQNFGNKSLVFISLALFFSMLQPGYSEVKTTYTEDEYWKGTTPQNEVIKRQLNGRTSENENFEVKNVSFNRTHHSFGRGEILIVTFDIINKLNDPFEGYMFVVADIEQRFKKNGDFYLLISDISPDPEGKTKDFHISSGVLPEYAKKIATSKDNSNLIGVLNKEELMKSNANDPTKGIPIKVVSETQIEVKHYIAYSREAKFFNHVLILIYSKDKEKMIAYELVDDPKKVGKKRLVHFKKEDNSGKAEYLLKEQYPLLYAKRYKLNKR